jgi:hypothetical protein
MRGIDPNGLGIGTEYFLPLEYTPTWAADYYSRLHVIAYTDNTNVRVSRIPRYGGTETNVWQGTLNRGEYYRYTTGAAATEHAIYHVTASEGVGTIANCYDKNGATFLPLWFAIHPAVAATPDQNEVTECLVAVDYEVFVENNGNVWDVINIHTANSDSANFSTAVFDELGGTLPDVDNDGSPDTDTLGEGEDVLILAQVSPGDMIPFGSLDTCYFTITSARDPEKLDTAFLVTRIREVEVWHDPEDTLFTEYPGNTAVINVDAMNDSWFRDDTVNIIYSSSLAWPMEFTTTFGAPLADDNADGDIDVSGVQPDTVRFPWHLRVTVPDGTPAGTRDTVFIRATSANYPLSVYSQTYRDTFVVVEALPVPDLEIRPNGEDSAYAGETVSYLFEVINRGNGPDVPDITLDEGHAGVWTYRLVDSDGVSDLTDSDSDGIPDVGTVAGISSGEKGVDTVYLELTIPYGTLSGEIDVTTVNAHSSVDPIEDVATATTKVLGIVDLAIEPDSSITIRPEESAIYQLRVTNVGGIPDTVDIGTYALPDVGWDYAFSFWDSGLPLVDSDNSGEIDVGALDSANTVLVRLSITPPSGLGSLPGLPIDTTVVENRYVWIRSHHAENQFDMEDSVLLVTIFEPILDIHNYPNPFSGSTRFVYTIPRAGKVSLNIYNRAGEHIRTLIGDEDYETGGIFEIGWDGLSEDGRRAAPGVYLYALQWRELDGESYASAKRIVKKALVQP